ncbi:MAG TPA: FkbM family methyltransferase [Bryobacteraceae bacterium]
MTPEELVEKLYLVCLGRSADPSGLVNATDVIRSTNDPTLVLKSILDSPEYAARISRSRAVDCGREVGQAVALLDRRLRIVDIGAQSLAGESHSYAALLGILGVQVVGFDPLREKLLERADKEAFPGLTLLPFAIGDGSSHTLHINNDDSTSSLFPLNGAHNSCFDHLATLRAIRTEEVTTRRLDDVLPEGPVDFLKLDVQGSELMVLQAAERTLSQTAVVHCEVEFSPIYVNQPLFPSVHEFLTSHNFVLIDLLIPNRYHYIVPSGRSTQDRLLWADAVFFHETSDSETLAVQALIAASVYKKPTLAEHLLERVRSNAAQIS